jgi:hypothetical protein
VHYLWSNRTWEAHSIAANLKDWLEAGAYECECWVPSAVNAEQHTFTMFKKPATVLYSVPTHAGPEGITKYGNVLPGVGAKNTDLQCLMKEGFACLRMVKQSQVVSCPSYLVFQFDSFQNSDVAKEEGDPDIWLNKVDVWPICTSFLSNMDVQHEQLDQLVNATVSFIKLKTKGTGSWPS